MATDVLGFLGVRGSGDWVTDQRPTNYREMILYLEPNGSAPLTALLSKISSQSTNDPQFNWWTKVLPTQGGAITTTYTDVGLTSAYVSGGVSGTVLYAKVAEAVADEFRVGHEALFRLSTDYSLDCVGEVVGVVKNGASSYVAVKLLESDDNSSSAGNYIADADRLLIIGNLNSEMADTPQSLTYDPQKYYNYTQIFRTSVSITGTAEQVALRTDSQSKENRREGLLLHGIEMEKAFLWGIKTEGTGANGKPKRTTEGLVPFIVGNSPSGNIGDFVSDIDYSGQTWLQGGKDFINAKLAQIFRYGEKRKAAFCGYAALQAINDLAETWGDIGLSVGQAEYGIRVTRWMTVFGEIALINHPLFSYESSNANSIVVLEPAKLKYRNMKNRDTKYLRNRQGNGVDGTIDEYLTEAGLEIHHPECFGYLNGIGEANTA